MKIELELDDPEFCNGCPLNEHHDFDRINCRLGYSIVRKSPNLPGIVEYVKDIPRPKECLMRNGR